MAKIIFKLPNTDRIDIDSIPGKSVMRIAVEASVPGILGECGGQAMCATCHVYVSPADAGHLSPIGEDEDEMLEATESPRTELSRLSCQLELEDDQTLTVEIPPAYL